MNKYIALPLILALCSNLYGIDDTKETKIEKKQIYSRTDAQDCLVYEGYERTGGNTGQLHFKNNCPTRVEAVACVIYPNGKKETLRAKNRVYKKGRWNVSIYEGMAPKSVSVTSSTGTDPTPPAPCS